MCRMTAITARMLGILQLLSYLLAVAQSLSLRRMSRKDLTSPCTIVSTYTLEKAMTLRRRRISSADPFGCFIAQNLSVRATTPPTGDPGEYLPPAPHTNQDGHQSS